MLCECLFASSTPSATEVLRVQSEYTLCTPAHCVAFDLADPAQADASVLAGLLLLTATAALWRLRHTLQKGR